MKKILINAFVCLSMSVSAQNVGIGTNTPKDYNKLEVTSTEAGFQLPRMTTAQRATLKSNIEALSAALSAQYSGMMVYDLTDNTLYMWDAGKSTNGDWANVLDEDASIDDADADPTNEYNTDLTLTGTTLNVIDGGGTESQDLSSLQDHDWYESTGTNQADAIGDNIYTNGKVGVGDSDPSANLSVVGVVRASDAANETEYVEIDHGGANAYINWVGDGNLDVRRTGTNIVIFEQDGDLSMQSDNSIKMPNNIRWVENTGDASYGNDDNWKSGSYTSTMNVESGNVIKLDANALLRLTGGSGNDDFYIRINIDGANGCADLNSEELGWIRASEDGNDHDNYRSYSYMDVINVTCNGTMRFRLQVKNTGDDSWQRRDAILTATKF